MTSRAVFGAKDAKGGFVGSKTAVLIILYVYFCYSGQSKWIILCFFFFCFTNWSCSLIIEWPHKLSKLESETVLDCLQAQGRKHKRSAGWLKTLVSGFGSIVSVRVFQLEVGPSKRFWSRALSVWIHPFASSSMFQQLFLHFPLFSLSSQGTAVFWYNLFKSGEGDYRTRHAACPVLVGSKWGESKLESSHIGLENRCILNAAFKVLCTKRDGVDSFIFLPIVCPFAECCNLFLMMSCSISLCKSDKLQRYRNCLLAPSLNRMVLESPGCDQSVNIDSYSVLARQTAGSTKKMYIMIKKILKTFGIKIVRRWLWVSLLKTFCIIVCVASVEQVDSRAGPRIPETLRPDRSGLICLRAKKKPIII